MNLNLSDDASLPNDLEILNAELKLIEAEQVAVANELRALMAAEDPTKGIFHAKEIHALRQNKIILDFRRQLRVVRIKRQANSLDY